MNIEISKERMLEMTKKLASMDFCTEQKVFYKNILRMVKADAEGRLLVLPCKVGEHPEETRLTQFLKYYPNAVLNNDGTPHEICARNLGIREFKGCLTESCVDCWNTPIEEE